jgi:hypothetical protein
MIVPNRNRYQQFQLHTIVIYVQLAVNESYF